MINKRNNKNKNFHKKELNNENKERKFDIRIPKKIWLEVIKEIQEDEEYTSKDLCELLEIEYNREEKWLKVKEIEMYLPDNVIIEREAIIKEREIVQEIYEERYRENTLWETVLMLEIEGISNEYKMMERDNNIMFVKYSKFRKELWEKAFKWEY